MLPFVLDNDRHLTVDALRTLVARSRDCPVDIATAYFTVSGYAQLKDELAEVGAFRLLIGHEPQTGVDVGVRPTVKQAMQAELGGMTLDPKTQRLVEDLIVFLGDERVAVRLFDQGFLHAKAYIFHQDRIGPTNRDDRMLPFAAVVGSSNFTGPGLVSNRELNLVHQVFTESDEAIDAAALEHVGYLVEGRFRETEIGVDLLDRREQPNDRRSVEEAWSRELSPGARRLIKSEVGSRAVMDLEQWFRRQWGAAVDFKDELIDLLNRSKFGEHPYTPYQIYLKALFEYLRDQLDASDQMLLGKTAVDLAEFQEDSVKRARRILNRYDGVLIADSVGLGKTWIGKRLLEDFSYHRREKAVVICPASLKRMWQRELAASTIAASVIGMEELGRDQFDVVPYGDADVILVDEAHNFRNDKSKRYRAIDELIQRHRGLGREGRRKKVILLTATPINNDLYDLLSLVQLFTQGEQDYFREVGIGDLASYFRNARRAARDGRAAPGEVLFNLLDEFVVRNTRPYIRVAYPNATIQGEPVRFPDRFLRTIDYSLVQLWGGAGLYHHIVDQISELSLAPYALESFRLPQFQSPAAALERGREQGLIGIFKTRFLKRLESSVEAFRMSVARAIRFERVYLELLDRGTIISSREYARMLQIGGQDADDSLDVDAFAEELADANAVQEYLRTRPTVPMREFEVARLRAVVEADLATLADLERSIAPIVAADTKLARLKDLLATDLKGEKVIVFTSYKDTARYLEEGLKDAAWLTRAGDPHVRRIDSSNHPEERMGIVASFAPNAMAGTATATDEEINILISTDVLSEGQNLQDCGVLINYDLTWNPIRLVQRSGRIDRLRSPHEKIRIWNMMPEAELEELLKLVQRLNERIGTIDDLGLLDASVLGEQVNPRTFNALRRIKDGDVSVLDEEERRAELGGPELLLAHLRSMLNDAGLESATTLPDGIHSGLRRDKCSGMFFYFRAPRVDGGHRHFWRYVDAKAGTITDNRFEIANIIACGPEEPRHIADHDRYAFQEKVIDHILNAEARAETTAVIATANDPIQKTLAEDIKAVMRSGEVDRDRAKSCLEFLRQPIGRAVASRLKTLRADYTRTGDTAALIEGMAELAADYGKIRVDQASATLRREDLELVCFEFVG